MIGEEVSSGVCGSDSVVGMSKYAGFSLSMDTVSTRPFS